MSDEAEIVQFEVVRGALRDAEEQVPPLPEAPPPVEDSGGGGGGGGDGPGLPEGCPVEPLGIRNDVCYYLDANRQLRAVKHRDHSRNGILGLFGKRIEYLYQKWPKLNQDGEPTGWKSPIVGERLMAAAARRGVWDPFDRVRGAGAWTGADGELIFHTGDVIFIFPKKNPWAGMKQMAPGLHGRQVYPAAPPGPRPDFEPVARAAGGGPAGTVLSLLKTWNWGQAEIHPLLLLGWIGAAMMGGALAWRPVAWITGGQGTGKSTLHTILKYLFDGAVVSVSDASAAGVWQKLGYATLPVLFDEMEAEEDNRKAGAVVKLARQAASGGLVLRGGADHESSQFVARSCFLFSSILVPPLMAQDRSRIAIMTLGDLSGRTPPVIDEKALRAAGAGLRRRLVDGWGRFAETLHTYRAALEKEHHTARGADQFGTLLAVADLLLYDGPPSDDQARGHALDVSLVKDWSDGEGEGEAFLNHLLSAIVEPYQGGGAKRTVGDWVHRAAGYAEPGESPNTDEANRVLGLYGLKVLFETADKGWLYLANRSRGLEGIFARSHWGGKSGATNTWVQAARNLPGAGLGGNMWFAGAQAKSTRMPLSLAAMPHTPGFANMTADNGEDLEG